MKISKVVYLTVNKTDYTAEVVFEVAAEEDDGGRVFHEVLDEFEIESITEDDTLDQLELDGLHGDFYSAITEWLDKNEKKLIQQAKYEED